MRIGGFFPLGRRRFQGGKKDGLVTTRFSALYILFRSFIPSQPPIKNFFSLRALLLQFHTNKRRTSVFCHKAIFIHFVVNTVETDRITLVYNKLLTLS